MLLWGVVGLLFATPASANLIDGLTNLEWLDLTLTQNKSVNTALADNPGWSLATDIQVAEMFTNAGIPIQDNVSRADDRADVLALLSTLGCTQFCTGTFNLGKGFATRTAGGLTRPLFAISPQPSPTGGGKATTLSGLTSDLDLADPNGGVYLIRVVPEPTTALLVGLGLAGLALRRRN